MRIQLGKKLLGFRNMHEKPSVAINFPTSLKDLEILVNKYSAEILLSKPDELKSQNTYNFCKGV